MVNLNNLNVLYPLCMELLLKAHGPIFKKLIFILCLNNNHSKNLNFESKFLSGQIVCMCKSILSAVVAYIFSCKISHEL